ncbi:serine/threonine-protein kinase Sgk2 [Xylaria flabelliformis]|nr:serine/threonine-protein kinase Sgk2 [Xylaria flabelliformis]
MMLSDNQINIIANHPLQLDQARDELLNCYDALSSEAVSTLLFGFLINKAISAFDNNVSATICGSLKGLVQGTYALELFRPLIDVVLRNSPDTVVWAAFLDLVESIQKPSTPPASLPAAYLETSSRTNTSRLDDKANAKSVKQKLFFEIKSCTFREVTGFWQKYFNNESCQQQQKNMYDQMFKDHGHNGWGFPKKKSDDDSVWEWLLTLQSRYLAGATNQLSNTKHFKELNVKGQMDVSFRSPDSKTDVLIAGLLKETHWEKEFKENLLQLARLVQGVFINQPTRRFVHAFLICGSIMELWVFDRAGPYSSGMFDIIQQPERFTRVLVRYATMDNNALGLDTFIEKAQKDQVTLYDANSTTEGEMTINLTERFVKQNAIVSRGTTCFKTDKNFVAKFAWQSAKRKLEVEHLKHVKQSGVRGVAKVVAYRTITTIKELREGLTFPQPYRFNDKASNMRDPHVDLSSVNASGRKRKSLNNGSDNTPNCKRRRSAYGASTHVPNDQAKLSLEMIDENQSSEQTSFPSELMPLLDGIVEDWENKVYSCVVVSPAGRVIRDFKSIKELLGSMRDAIEAHQSLFTDGKILHRDISSNNIIITDAKAADGFRGMLIDLDLAKQMDDSIPSGADHRTGTRPFLAIGVLRQQERHTYRHDLESFFYVLLWMCARTSWGLPLVKDNTQQPFVSNLNKWSIGSFEDIADAKMFHMSGDGLECIFKEFPEEFEVVKPLCQRIRAMLFPRKPTDELDLSTPKDPMDLYRPIMAAYDEAISGLP